MLKITKAVIIFGIELAYLGLLFDLYTLAASVIASIGVAFALVSFALQNHLKNTVSGIGLYLNKRIDIGDIIEIDGQKGTIIEFNLMKTMALTDDGKFIHDLDETTLVPDSLGHWGHILWRKVGASN